MLRLNHGASAQRRRNKMLTQMFIVPPFLDLASMKFCNYAFPTKNSAVWLYKRFQVNTYCIIVFSANLEYWGNISSIVENKVSQSNFNLRYMSSLQASLYKKLQCVFGIALRGAANA